MVCSRVCRSGEDVVSPMNGGKEKKNEMRERSKESKVRNKRIQTETDILVLVLPDHARA